MLHKEKFMTDKEHWSKNIIPHWHPPEGFFNGSAESIAKGLRDDSVSLAQAIDRLNFFINRAGSNLTEEDKVRLGRVKEILNKLFE